MRVQHNIMSMNAYRNYNNNSSALSKNLEKLSSGYRINRAGDDAAGLAISEKMRAEISGLGMAQKNAQDGVSLIQTAEGALDEVNSMLNRMYELAVQASNGTYDNNDITSLQSEVDALQNEIERITSTTKFNGKDLFGQTINLQIGATGDANNQLSVAIGNVTKPNITLTNGAANLDTIKGLVTAVTEVRGDLGAIQNRLEHTIKNLSVTEENLQNAESAIRDTDVADEMMAYTKNNILIQSAQAMLAQANQVPQGVLQLLQ